MLFRLHRSSRPTDGWESTACLVHGDCLDGTLVISTVRLTDAALPGLKGKFEAVFAPKRK